MIRIGPLKLKAQLLHDGEGAFGPGKADLLEAIERAGSISAAGRALGMSYRRTWLLVDAMNRCWRERLVETVPGGGKDSGARVTPFGRRILDAYRAMEHDLEGVAAPYAGQLGALLRAASPADGVAAP